MNIVAARGANLLDNTLDTGCLPLLSPFLTPWSINAPWGLLSNKLLIGFLKDSKLIEGGVGLRVKYDDSDVFDDHTTLAEQGSPSSKQLNTCHEEYASLSYFFSSQSSKKW